MVFYNLVLKQGHQEKHFQTQYRRATVHHHRRTRTRTAKTQVVADESSLDSSISVKEGDEFKKHQTRNIGNSTMDQIYNR